VTIEAGSWMKVVNTNVTRTTAATPIASARTKALVAPAVANRAVTLISQ
jgi:hypothetical protein